MKWKCSTVCQVVVFVKGNPAAFILQTPGVKKTQSAITEERTSTAEFPSRFTKSDWYSKCIKLDHCLLKISIEITQEARHLNESSLAGAGEKCAQITTYWNIVRQQHHSQTNSKINCIINIHSREFNCFKTEFKYFTSVGFSLGKWCTMACASGIKAK